MVRKMLNRGADINCYNEDMASPLHIAIERYDKQMVKLFLDHPGINVNIKDSQWNTPLHYALEFKHLDLVPMLMEKGADVNARNTFDRTPLHIAVKRCLVDQTQLLLDRGAEIDVEDVFGKTPLKLGMLKYKCSILTRLLLKNGASVNKATKAQISILSEAVLHARNEADRGAIQTMIRYGAAINEPDPVGLRTPLHFIALTSNVQLARTLLECGADPTILNAANQLPYRNAQLFCNNEMAELLEFYAKQKMEGLEQTTPTLGFQLLDEEEEPLGLH